MTTAMFLSRIPIPIPTGLRTGMVEVQTKSRTAFRLLQAMTGVLARLQSATMKCVMLCTPRQRGTFCTHCALGGIRMLSIGVIIPVRAGECGEILSRSGTARSSEVGGSVCYLAYSHPFPRITTKPRPSANCQPWNILLGILRFLGT